MKTMQRNSLADDPIGLLLDPAARSELTALGLSGRVDAPRSPGLDPVPGRTRVPRRRISAKGVLNEAYDYHPQPVSFSRGLRVELGDTSMLLLSGTASVDEHGATVHPGNLQAQCMRTFRNLTELLVAENASWHDVVRTTCYLRDIERDYEEFNDMRTLFIQQILGLDPLPASTGIQVRLCRSDLLVEIEAIAMIPATSDDGRS